MREGCKVQFPVTTLKFGQLRETVFGKFSWLCFKFILNNNTVWLTSKMG